MVNFTDATVKRTFGIFTERNIEELCKFCGSKSRDFRFSKLKVIDPDLLLAYTYFEREHCGYLVEKDAEDILNLLPLNLSRSQVGKIFRVQSYLLAEIQLVSNFSLWWTYRNALSEIPHVEFSDSPAELKVSVDLQADFSTFDSLKTGFPGFAPSEANAGRSERRPIWLSPADRRSTRSNWGHRTQNAFSFGRGYWQR